MTITVPCELSRLGLTVGLEMAERLRSPETVRATVCRPDNVRPPQPERGVPPGTHPWRPGSLASGHPGIAVLHTVLAQHEPSLRQAAHAHLASAADAPRDGSAGLFGGYGAIVFPAAVAAASTGGYATLLGRLEPILAAYARDKVAHEQTRLRRGEAGIGWEAYDAITGLAGVGRVLLMGIDEGRTAHREALDQILEFFVTVSKPIDVDGHQVPGWWNPPHRYLTARDAEFFPEGDFNVGLAHGICGPLALLAITLLHGVEVPGQTEAMGRILDWLTSRRGGGETEPYWPDRVSWEAQVRQAAGPGIRAESVVPSWCYGTAGVARAIQLAGRALGDPAVERMAVAALCAALRRGASTWQFADATFCHGTAGLLQAAWRVADDTADPELVAHIVQLAADVLATYDPQAPFGYRHLARNFPEPEAADQRAWWPLDAAGALDGAAGVALTVLTVTGNVDVGHNHAWDAAFLLS